MLATKSTTVEKSNRKYDILEAYASKAEEVVPLNQLSDMPPFARVTCKAKVVDVDKIIHTTDRMKMQNALITDGQACARVTIWEKETGSIQVNKTYLFSGIMMIREAKEKKFYLSTAQNNCNIVEIS